IERLGDLFGIDDLDDREGGDVPGPPALHLSQLFEANLPPLLSGEIPQLTLFLNPGGDTRESREDTNDHEHDRRVAAKGGTKVIENRHNFHGSSAMRQSAGSASPQWIGGRCSTRMRD